VDEVEAIGKLLGLKISWTGGKEITGDWLI
jgi:hypothetical protein